MTTLTPKPRHSAPRSAAIVALSLGGLVLAAVLLWQAFTQGGSPDPLAPRFGFNAAALDIAVLVFREGLECILVLAAITATMGVSSEDHRRRRWPLGLGPRS